MLPLLTAGRRIVTVPITAIVQEIATVREMLTVWITLPTVTVPVTSMILKEHSDFFVRAV